MVCFLRDGDEDKFRRTKLVLEELGYEKDDISDSDCANMQYICSVLSKRAAYLASAGEK